MRRASIFQKTTIKAEASSKEMKLEEELVQGRVQLVKQRLG